MATPLNAATLVVIALVVLGMGGATGYYLATHRAGSGASAAGPAQTREFYVFTGGLEFNETALGIPHDMFVPDHLVVNKGDTVLIHFYNLEDTDEHHTFTIGAPYSQNVDVPPGQEANLTFVASVPGVFQYRCEIHQPTMTGQLVVLG